ncbi:hypothetical protein [Hydrocarboniphaga sp.]|uniref:hypothetical protein n=1 Tax=Hydrocarboniphaga sp. TaxID=2033016 RepID=UPI003D0DEAFA
MNDIHDNEHEHELPPIAGLKGLSMERAPEHDLWPAIQARIQTQAQTQRVQRLPPPRRRWVPLAAAASVTALIAGLIVVRQLQTPPPGAPTTVAAVSGQPATTSPQLAQADDGLHTVAMRAASRDEMQGANRALIKANLKIVKSAESQLRQALAADPNDAYLQNLLLSTQSQKQHLSGLLDRQLI